MFCTTSPIHAVGNDDVVYSAGVAAQRRRRSLSGYRRSCSSSNVPLRHTTQRNSLGLDTFMSVLNNNAQNGKRMVAILVECA